MCDDSDMNDGWSTWHNKRRNRRKKCYAGTQDNNSNLDNPANFLPTQCQGSAAPNDREKCPGLKSGSWHSPRKTILRFLASPDFDPIRKCLEKAELECKHLINLFAEHMENPVGNLHFSLHFCAFGLGDMRQNRNSLPQLCFFHTLARDLSESIFIAANPKFEKSARAFSKENYSAHIYDPIYSTYQSQDDILGINLLKNHNYFTQGQLSDIFETTCLPEVPVFVLFLPHVPIELPSLLLFDLQKALKCRKNPVPLRSLVIFIGNRIFPEHVPRIESKLAEYDVSFDLPCAYGAFNDMKITCFKTGPKGLQHVRPRNIDAHLDEEMIFCDCARVLRHMNSKRTELVHLNPSI